MSYYADIIHIGMPRDAKRSVVNAWNQPHPDDAALARTLPHHKHIPPDAKHHRLPAPGLSFTEPNLPFLIAEIEQDLLKALPR